MKRLRNSSGLSDETVRGIIDWIAETLGISGFDVECRNCSGTLAGTAYSDGSHSHGTARPFVVLRIGTEKIISWRAGHYIGRNRTHVALGGITPVKVEQMRFPTTVTPYQYRHHKGKRYAVTSRTEALVYIAAHELRHLWQAARMTDKRKSAAIPMFPNSKGKFSEVDTESFAIHTLRAWRKQHA